MLLALNMDAFQFLMYKIRFFTTEIWSSKISSSPSIRIFEYKNIVHEISSNFLCLIFGNGFGGSFNMNKFVPDVELSSAAFSYDQLNSGIFFRPHTFINFCLLKGGLSFLIMYSISCFFLFLNSYFLLKNKDQKIQMFAFYCLFFSIFSFSMFWQPSIIFLFGILVIISIHFNSEKN
jgi:hypothetical protein